MFSITSEFKSEAEETYVGVNLLNYLVWGMLSRFRIFFKSGEKFLSVRCLIGK